jgi:coproporphyrinogen III oxidase-like Fe-S oxidoreductase
MGFGFGAIGSASSVVRNAFNQVKSNQALKGQEYAQLKDAAPQIIAQALSLNPDNIQAKQLMAQLNSGNGLSTGDFQKLRTLAEESAAVNTEAQKIPLRVVCSIHRESLLVVTLLLMETQPMSMHL